MHLSFKPFSKSTFLTLLLSAAVALAALAVPAIAQEPAFDGWLTVAPGIQERFLDGNRIERRASGEEGLRSVLPLLQAGFEVATDDYFREPKPETWSVVEAYTNLVSEIGTRLAGGEGSGRTSAPMSKAATNCAQTNSFLNAQVFELSCGNQALASAGFLQAGTCTSCLVYSFTRVQRKCHKALNTDVDFAGPQVGSLTPIVVTSSLSGSYSSCYSEATSWAYCPGDGSFHQVVATSTGNMCGSGITCALCINDDDPSEL